MESFEIGKTTKLGLRYKYLTENGDTNKQDDEDDNYNAQEGRQRQKNKRQKETQQHHPSGLGPALLDPSADGPATQGTTEIHYRNRDADQHLPHALMSVLVV